MKTKIKPYRIWDNKSRSFINNGSSLHCFSQWMIDAETGELFDAVGEYGDKNDSRFLSKNPDYYMNWAKRSGKKIHIGNGKMMPNPIVKRQRYLLQRFTGLKDKNKTPIYEGDMVKYSHKDGFRGTSFVTYYDLHAAFGLFTKRAVLLSDCTLLEVIGNKMELKLPKLS